MFSFMKRKRETAPKVSEYTSINKLHGVFNTLSKRGYDDKQGEKMIYAYLQTAGQSTDMSLEDACVFIQSDFTRFMQFIKQQKPADKY